MATLCIASDCVTCKYQNSVLCHAVSCTRHNSSFFPVTFFVLKNVPEHFSHVATQAGFELASIRHVTRITASHATGRLFTLFFLKPSLMPLRTQSLFLKPSLMPLRTQSLFLKPSLMPLRTQSFFLKPSLIPLRTQVCI